MAPRCCPTKPPSNIGLADRRSRERYFWLIGFFATLAVTLLVLAAPSNDARGDRPCPGNRGWVVPIELFAGFTGTPLDRTTENTFIDRELNEAERETPGNLLSVASEWQLRIALMHQT
jgi:hypothetical protein